MLTELQAKEKWCPQVRQVADNCKVAGNRGHKGESGGPCIASACMMWRWDETQPVSQGYCGLASQPAVAF